MSDLELFAFAGTGPDGRDRRHCRLSRARGARRRGAGPARRRACRTSPSSACPTRRWRESRERVRAALAAIGLALPPKRITVNLSPADLPKEGSHYDLPIALVPAGGDRRDRCRDAVALCRGRRALPRRADRRRRRACCSPRSTPRRSDKGLICPAAQGSEAAWAGELEVIAAPDLLALLAHLKGTALVAAPAAAEAEPPERRPRPRPGQGAGSRQARARDRRGRRPQSADERAAGRGQVAARRLPAGHPAAAAAVRSARSVDGRVGRRRARAAAGSAGSRPFRAPHHSASMPALVGGGLQGAAGRDQPRASRRAVPRRACPNSSAPVLDSLRQPLETGTVSVARANAHVTFPGAGPAGRGDEPVPLRPSRRSGAGLQPRAALRRRLPGARSRGRCSTASTCMSKSPACRAADLTLPPPAEGSAEVGRARRRGARRSRPSATTATGVAHQCRGRRRAARRGRDARRAGPQAARRGRRGDAPVGARLPPRAARRADHRRPRREPSRSAGSMSPRRSATAARRRGTRSEPGGAGLR